MGAQSNDRVRSQSLSRFVWRDVVLSQMNPVGAAGTRQLGVVVDDEEGAEGVGDAAEGSGGAFDLRPPQLLLAQLDDVGAAAQRRSQQRFQVARRPGIADEVEASGAQALAAQGTVPLWRRQAHASIMAGEGPGAAAGAGGGVASELHGSPRGLRGWHRGHRPFRPDPGNAGGG